MRNITRHIEKWQLVFQSVQYWLAQVIATRITWNWFLSFSLLLFICLILRKIKFVKWVQREDFEIVSIRRFWFRYDTVVQRNSAECQHLSHQLQPTSLENVVVISFWHFLAHTTKVIKVWKIELIEHHFVSELHPNPIEMALVTKLATLSSGKCSTIHSSTQIQLPFTANINIFVNSQIGILSALCYYIMKW